MFSTPPAPNNIVKSAKVIKKVIEIEFHLLLFMNETVDDYRWLLP